MGRQPVRAQHSSSVIRRLAPIRARVYFSITVQGCQARSCSSPAAKMQAIFEKLSSTRVEFAAGGQPVPQEEGEIFVCTIQTGLGAPMFSDHGAFIICAPADEDTRCSCDQVGLVLGESLDAGTGTLHITSR